MKSDNRASNIIFFTVIALFAVFFIFLVMKTPAQKAEPAHLENAAILTKPPLIEKKPDEKLVIYSKEFPQLSNVGADFKATNLKWLYARILHTYSTEYSKRPFDWFIAQSTVTDVYATKNKFQTDKTFNELIHNQIAKDSELTAILSSYILVSDNGFYSKYHPSTKEYSFDLPTEVKDIFTQDLSNFVGQNAFGVTVDAKKTTSDVFKIKFANTKGKKITFPMSPELAQEHESSLSVIYVVKLRYPYLLHEDYEYQRATIDDPVQRTWYYYDMNAVLQGLAIYDSKTGEVFYNTDKI